MPMGFADDPDDNDQIRQAMLKRILSEIEGGRASGGGATINNNVYGGEMGGGVREQMAQMEPADVPDRDYFVDIVRRDLEDLNPVTGKPAGWRKSVHRFSSEKKK